MPAFLTVLFVQGVVRVVLAAIGIGIVSFVGVQALVSSVSNQIRDSFNGLPADALALLGIAQVDLAVSIILSAYSVRASLYALRRMRIL